MSSFYFTPVILLRRFFVFTQFVEKLIFGSLTHVTTGRVTDVIVRLHFPCKVARCIIKAAFSLNTSCTVRLVFS